MRDLTAAGNPFAGQYTEFDRWAFEHYINPNSRLFREVYVEGSTTLPDKFYVSVNDDGYVVPMATQIEWQLDPPATHQQNPCQFSFYSGGELAPELKQWLQAEGVKHLARASVQIPAWLADNPPRWATPAHDGEWLTLGRLGSGAQLEPELSVGQLYNMPHVEDDAPDNYCRYSATGELVGETAPGAEWWRLFFTDIDERAAELAQGMEYEVREYQGTIVVYEKTSWTALGTFDYYGNTLDVGQEKYGAQDLLSWIYGGNLRGVYAEQQRTRGGQASTLAEAD